jgi:hypothetical protein
MKDLWGAGPGGSVQPSRMFEEISICDWGAMINSLDIKRVAEGWKLVS